MKIDLQLLFSKRTFTFYNGLLKFQNRIHSLIIILLNKGIDIKHHSKQFGMIYAMDLKTHISKSFHMKIWVKVVDALLSSLLNPLEGPSVWIAEIWNLEALPTSSTKGGKRGVLEVLGLD
jgi:hypothetical protein